MARPRFDRDYYGILGVPTTAIEDDVRRAYRRLALRWHPDRNPADDASGERFKEISEAYAVLIDAARRAEYDRVRGTERAGEFRHAREDLFRDLFADPRASAVFDELAREFARLGLRVDRRDFHQTLSGGRTVVTGTVVIVTPFTPVLALARLARAALRGARAARHTGGEHARQRPRAAKRVGRALRWLLGLPSTPAIERGNDVIITLTLTRADAERGGERRVTLPRGETSDEVLVKIPPGVSAGTRLRLRGKGRASPGGGSGDAYLAIEIAG